MLSTGSVGLLIAIVTILVSISAFRREAILSRCLFAVDGILVHREYGRLILSGFIHADWRHLAFNMYALLTFAGTVEYVAGPWQVLTVYGASLVGGNLLSLYIHRNDGAYRALGASGAVSGLIFASIVLFPSMSVSPLFLPFRMPGWLFGLLYTLFTIYGIKSLNDGVGHDAHLGGALTGILTICLLNIGVVQQQWPFVLILTLPTVIFLYFVVTRPEWLYLKGFTFKSQQHETIDERYNGAKFQRQQEIDRILDKISETGLDSLTDQERNSLKNQRF
jgi:membrane associated rhomboid family serine protease